MISKTCMIRVLPGLEIHHDLILATWYLGEKEYETARSLLGEAKDIVDQTLKAKLMDEKVAQRITAGVNYTLVALDNKDYEKAKESVAIPSDSAVNHALQQAVKCEVSEPLRKNIEMRERLEAMWGEG